MMGFPSSDPAVEKAAKLAVIEQYGRAISAMTWIEENYARENRAIEVAGAALLKRRLIRALKAEMIDLQPKG